MVAWQTVCQPKDEEGIGIKNLELSNVAMIGRLVDWVAEKRDSIWVRWVHANYIKDQDWMDYQPSSSTSWVWRRVCAVKQKLAGGYNDGVWAIQPHGYSPSGCYEWLRGTAQPQAWTAAFWNDWVIPKHQFFGWLYAHGGLRTRDNLKKIGVFDDDICTICGQGSESKEHLFMNCEYSRLVLTEMQQETRLQFPSQQLLEWCLVGPATEVQKRAKASVVLGVCYAVWHQRNRGRIEYCIRTP
ncbi:hypothetical protein vseg_000833 [Gypsophila vaccaria]